MNDILRITWQDRLGEFIGDHIWLVVFLMFPIVGLAIGRQRGHGKSGFFWGLVLGPIGWLIVLTLPARGKQPTV